MILFGAGPSPFKDDAVTGDKELTWKRGLLKLQPQLGMQGTWQQAYFFSKQVSFLPINSEAIRSAFQHGINLPAAYQGFRIARAQTIVQQKRKKRVRAVTLPVFVPQRRFTQLFWAIIGQEINLNRNSSSSPSFCSQISLPPAPSTVPKMLCNKMSVTQPKAEPQEPVEKCIKFNSIAPGNL